MKKILFYLLLITSTAFAQVPNATPDRTKGKTVVDQYFKARFGLAIPAIAGTTPTITQIDSAGTNMQLTNGNGYLSVSKGLGTGFWQYTPKSYNDATYSTPASVATQIAASVPTLQQVTTSGSTTTSNIQAGRVSSGKSNGGEQVESNGVFSAFGSINAHAADRASFGYTTNYVQLWSHGQTSTVGGLQLLVRNGAGGLGGTALTILPINSRMGLFGVTAPTAWLQLPAGLSSASGAPLKFSGGTLMSSPENGADEYDGTYRYFTPSATTRKRFILSNNVTPTSGQVLIANGIDWTVTSPTIDIASSTPTLPSGTIATTQSQGDSTTKVANTAYVNREFDTRTGWASYTDNVYTSASPLSVTSGSTVTLTNNAATSITSNLPTGVTAFYNSGTSKITPQNNGDYYDITIRFKAKNTETQGGYFDFGIDIGGSLGVIFKESKLFVKGANTEQNFSITCSGYSAATFVANGGLVKITGGNGTTTIYDIEFQISRTHKAK